MWSLWLAQSTRMDDIETAPYSGVKTEEGKSSYRCIRMRKYLVKLGISH